MTEHLGYPKDSPDGKNTGNNRNGKSKKTVNGAEGDFEIETDPSNPNSYASARCAWPASTRK